MAHEHKTACCANGSCATGRGASGWPLVAIAAVLALVWAVSGNTGWLMLAAISGAAGAAWLALTWWANRAGMSGVCYDASPEPDGGD